MIDKHTDALDEAYLEEDEDTQKDKYLTFHIAECDYALEVRHVVEIVGIQKITEVPDVEDYVKGVINLRGQVIPVIDVRRRFRLEEKPYGDRTCTIIVNIEGTVVGLIVDEVAEVLDIPLEQVSPPPKTGKGAQGRYLQGIGRIGDGVKLILKADALLNEQDLEAVAAIQE